MVHALTDVVLSVLGVAEFVDEELDRVGGGAQEAQAAEMAHLLSCLVIYATVKRRSVVAHLLAGLNGVLCEVDFVIEEGGLSGCRGHDGDLA